MSQNPSPVWPGVAAPTPSLSPRPTPSGRAPLAATLVAVGLFGALVGFAGSQALNHSANPLAGVAGIDRLLSGAPAPAPQTAPAQPAANAPAPAPRSGQAQQPGGTAPAPAPSNPNPGRPAPSAPSSNDPAQAAVQQAIQSIDDAQVKATSSKDLSGLTAGATSAFASEQTSVTQDLLSSGVTDIKLVNIEWGPIAVNGNTATATAFETWSTTYSDGSTEQSRDRNDYTLVQQDGSWKVQSDAHPDAQSGGLPNAQQDTPGNPRNILPPGNVRPSRNRTGNGA